ncbi:MAG: glycosyltransferase family 2 protein [Elusimicrobia bacterium]|nr:glycosyltransferase family 2 protein [Elusimicrobiota bacterium]
MLLSVVVPCCDEEAAAGRFAEELLPALDALAVPTEVIAVDDGSYDDTAAVLRNLAGERRNFRAVALSEHRGLGAAMRTGFAEASGDWIATLDADLTFHPSQLRALLDCQKATGADMVCGSPFLAPAGAAQVRWWRRLPSRWVNGLYRRLCGPRLTAYTAIFRLYRTEALRALRLESQGFEINAEIAARFLAAGKTVAEVPAVLTARRQGASKLSPLRELWRHGRLALRLRREALPR